MDYHLTVTQPFGDYARGDRITDKATVAEVLASHPQNVVKHEPFPEDKEDETPAPAPVKEG